MVPDRLLGLSRVQFRHMSRIQDPLPWPLSSIHSATCKLSHPHVSYCVRPISLNLGDAIHITFGRGRTEVRFNKTKKFIHLVRPDGGVDDVWELVLLTKMLTNWMRTGYGGRNLVCDDLIRLLARSFFGPPWLRPVTKSLGPHEIPRLSGEFSC